MGWEGITAIANNIVILAELQIKGNRDAMLGVSSLGRLQNLKIILVRTMRLI